MKRLLKKENWTLYNFIDILSEQSKKNLILFLIAYGGIYMRKKALKKEDKEIYEKGIKNGKEIGYLVGYDLGYEKGMNRGMLTMFILVIIALALSIIMKLLGVW